MTSTQTVRKYVAADWQNKSGSELATCLATVFRTVRDESEWRTDKDDYHWGLYSGAGESGVKLRSRANMEYLNATLPDNVCKMAVDTLTAKVATIRPIPQVLTSRGNYKDQRRARKLRQLIDGEFYRQCVHEKLANRIIKDALVCRGGVVQVDVCGKRPKVERVHIWTMYTDDWDAEFGQPRSLYRLRTMDRAAAIKRFGKTPELREKLKSAGFLSNSTSRNQDEARSSTVDRIELLEAWHRCLEHDDEDDDHVCAGKHALICDGATLFEEEWPHDWFPFAWLTYDEPNTGFFGNGLVQTLEGYQVSIDRANTKVDEAFEASGALVLLQDGAGVFRSDIVNGVRVAHVRQAGGQPIVEQLDLVSETMRSRVPELVERALNASGVSQMSAQSQKPAGVDSGIALQTLDDVESQRHIVFGRRFESWCMDVARLLVEAIKKIAKKYGDYAVKVPMRGTYLDLKWSDVEIDGFQLQMQSVGQLFTSFAGRLEKLKTLLEMGAIDAGTFMRHLDAGDVQSELDLETVDRIIVDEMLEAMLDATDEAANDNGDAPDPAYIAPNEYLPLDWAHRRTHQRRLQAQMEGAPERVLALLDRYIDDLEYCQDKVKAKAMTDAGGPVDPMAAPAVDPNMAPPAAGPMVPPPMPVAMSPAGDQLMAGPDGAMPPIAA